jgi:hypothetical protein
MTDTFRPRTCVEAVIDDDGAVLLDVLQGKYYSLNTLGAEIWRDIEGRRTRDEIVAALRRRCDVPSLDEDVDAFIDNLCRLQLLETV